MADVVGFTMFIASTAQREVYFAPAPNTGATKDADCATIAKLFPLRSTRDYQVARAMKDEREWRPSNIDGSDPTRFYREYWWGRTRAWEALVAEWEGGDVSVVSPPGAHLPLAGMKAINEYAIVRGQGLQREPHSASRGPQPASRRATLRHEAHLRSPYTDCRLMQGIWH